MAFDIAAIQLMYGAAASNAGNTVYTLRDDAVGASYSCIWDTGGIDTIQYAGSRDATIDLRAASLANGLGGGGFLSSVDGVAGGFTIAADVTDFDRDGNFGVVIENAIGGSGGDTLIGNAASNRLEGGAGSDELYGRGGLDMLIGGADDDNYLLDDVARISAGGMLVGATPSWKQLAKARIRYGWGTSPAVCSITPTIRCLTTWREGHDPVRGQEAGT